MLQSDAISTVQHLIACLDEEEAVVGRVELELILRALEATVQAVPA